MTTLTPREVKILSPWLLWPDLLALRYEVGWGPFWFLWWANQGAVTWPWTQKVYCSPRYWPKWNYGFQLAVLAHEFIHTRQLRWMGAWGFVVAYFLRGKKVELEAEGYAMQERVYSWMQQHPEEWPI